MRAKFGRRKSVKPPLLLSLPNFEMDLMPDLPRDLEVGGERVETSWYDSRE